MSLTQLIPGWHAGESLGVALSHFKAANHAESAVPDQWLRDGGSAIYQENAGNPVEGINIIVFFQLRELPRKDYLMIGPGLPTDFKAKDARMRLIWPALGCLAYCMTSAKPRVNGHTDEPADLSRVAACVVSLYEESVRNKDRTDVFRYQKSRGVKVVAPRAVAVVRCELQTASELGFDAHEGGILKGGCVDPFGTPSGYSQEEKTPGVEVLMLFPVSYLRLVLGYKG